MQGSAQTSSAVQADVPSGASRDLVVTQLPDKLKYRAGEEVDFTGLRVAWRRPAAETPPAPAQAGAPYIDVDVSAQVLTSLEEGTAWRADDKKVEVELAWVDPQGTTHYGGPFELKRKRRLLPLLLLLALIAALVAAGIGVYLATRPAPEPEQALEPAQTGGMLYPQGDMTDEELQAMLDELAEKSRISVSVAQRMQLQPDGRVRVNFIVDEPNNGLNERMELIQDGKVVYTSEIVAPGRRIEWAQAEGAHAGPATATVHAVDEYGRDSGSPISVEVEIVEGG